MIIDLDKITEASFPLDVKISAGEIDLGSEDVILKNDVELKGAIEKHIYEIDIAGNIKAAAEINCDRCLSPIQTTLEIPFKISYISSEYESSEKEMQIGGDDLDVDFYEDEKLDLAKLVREQIILNSSKTALCKPDCLGLCQKCGANKNEKKCDCSEREIDPRFKVLENLTTEKE
jgi:uncharacterized protein